MRELYRVMSPGGWGIFQVPLDSTREKTYEDKSVITPEAREEHFWQKDHVRLFSLDYKTRLEEAGFKVTADDYVNTLGAELVDRYRLPAGELVYFCEKKEIDRAAWADR